MLVAGQAPQMGVAYLVGRECLGPHTHFHHIAAINSIIGEQTLAEPQRGYLVLQQIRRHTRLIAGDILRAGVETYGLLIKVVHHDHACEVSGGEFFHLTRTQPHHFFLVVLEDNRQTVVCGQHKLQVVHRVSMSKEHHVTALVGRTYHHIDSQVGDSQFAAGGGLQELVVVAAQIERCGLSDTRRIRHATQLEMVVLIKPVAGYGFTEAERDIVLQSEYPVGGLCFAEKHRRTRVFDTTHHRRRLAHKPRAVAAERHRTQVVTEFLRVAVTVETEGGDAAVLNLGFVARGLRIEAVIGIEGALVHPRIVVLGGQFVLELDVVEVLVIKVESVDGHRQVIAYRVLGGERVHHPFVARESDRHR